MGKPKAAYLIRGDDGKMATVVAQSIEGAVKKYLQDYAAAPGDELSVKKRGEGDWEDFVVRG